MTCKAESNLSEECTITSILTYKTAISSPSSLDSAFGSTTAGLLGATVIGAPPRTLLRFALRSCLVLSFLFKASLISPSGCDDDCGCGIENRGGGWYLGCFCLAFWPFQYRYVRNLRSIMDRPREPFGAVPSISPRNSLTRVEERGEEVMTSTVLVPRVGGPDAHQARKSFFGQWDSRVDTASCLINSSSIS